MGFIYYYRDQRNQKITIESFHPFYKQAFIRSNTHMDVSDCLLSLPSLKKSPRHFLEFEGFFTIS